MQNQRKISSAFTVVEMLVTIGVMVVVGALIAPSISQARRSGRQLSSDQRIRSVGLGIQAYANDSKDLPPVLFSQRFAFYPPEIETVRIGDDEVVGLWWDVTFHYIHPLASYSPVASAFAPRSLRYVADAQRIATQAAPDYQLSQAFYAEPAFWNRRTKVGPSQFGAQALSNVRYSGQKVLLLQHNNYLFPEFGSSVSTLAEHIPASIAWADGSAGSVFRSELEPGVPNCWQHSYRQWLLGDGSPGDETEDGVHGIDRRATGSR